MVPLSDPDSNNYHKLMRFKQSISARLYEVGLNEKIPSETRKINKYGEIIATRIKQEQRYLNEDDIQILITEYLNGKSAYQLSKRFGCSRTTVGRILRRHNVIVTNDKIARKLDAPDIVYIYENPKSLRMSLLRQPQALFQDTRNL